MRALWQALVLITIGCSSADDAAVNGVPGGAAGAGAAAGDAGVQPSDGSVTDGRAGSTGVGGAGGKGGSGGVGTGGFAGAGGSGGKGGSGGVGTGGSAGAGGSGGTAGSAGAGTGGSAGKADAGADAGPSSARQTARPLGGANTAPNGYYEYLPPGYDSSAAAPLLVFWHGIGEDGNGTSDLSKVLAWGPPKVIANNKWDSARPFIVLSPQYTAANGGGIAPGAGCPSSATIDGFLTWAIGHYNVDPKRVYITGLSCGAIGGWDYLAHHLGAVVAGAVLLSGNPGDPTQAGSAWQVAGCSLGGAAIWSFHGDADGTVPYAPDHDTLQNLIACPAPPRRAAVFTDVVGGGHIIWDPIYDLSGGYGDIYAWMLTNAKP